MENLSKWMESQENARWWRFKDNKVIEGELVDVRLESSSFSSEEIPCYYVNVEGQCYKFQSKASSLSKQIKNLEAGQPLRITRTGEGSASRYDVELTDGKMVRNQDEADQAKDLGDK